MALVDDEAGGQRVLSFDRDVETAIYNTLPDNLDRLLKRHPLKCPVAFIGGTRSEEMQQVGMAMTQKPSRGRIMMLDGSHLFPMEKAAGHRGSHRSRAAEPAGHGPARALADSVAVIGAGLAHARRITRPWGRPADAKALDQPVRGDGVAHRLRSATTCRGRSNAARRSGRCPRCAIGQMPSPHWLTCTAMAPQHACRVTGVSGRPCQHTARIGPEGLARSGDVVLRRQPACSRVPWSTPSTTTRRKKSTW
jgi:hypothetical protein